MDLLAIGGPHATKGFGRAALGSAQARAETAWRGIVPQRSCSAYRLRCQFRHAVAECLATTRRRFPPGAILSGSSEKTHATPRASAGPDLASREQKGHRALEAERLAPGKKKAARLGAHLVFADESGFLLAPLVVKTWAPRGCTPLHHHRQGRRDKISVISGISLSPQRRHRGLYYLLFYALVHLNAFVPRDCAIPFSTLLPSDQSLIVAAPNSMFHGVGNPLLHCVLACLVSLRFLFLLFMVGRLPTAGP